MLNPSVICVDVGNSNLRMALVRNSGPSLCQLGGTGRLLQAAVRFTDTGRIYGSEASTALVHQYESVYTSVPFLAAENASLLSTPRFLRLCSCIGGKFTEDPAHRLGIAIDKHVYPSDILLLSLLSHALESVAEESHNSDSIVLTYQPYWCLNKLRHFIVATEALGRTCIGMFSSHLALGAGSLITLMQKDKDRLKTRYILVGIVDIGEFSSCCAIYKFGCMLLETVYINYQTELGARDFDLCLCKIFLNQLLNSSQRHLHDEFQLENPNGPAKKLTLRLFSAAREAKKILTVNKSAVMTVEGVGEMAETISFRITLAEFEDSTKHLCAEIAQLASTDIFKDVSVLQFTGGGSRIPCIRSAVLQAIKEKERPGCTIQVDKTVNPDTALVEGAAWLAILTLDKFPKKANYIIRDICFHSILLDCISADGVHHYCEGAYIFSAGDYFPNQKEATVKVAGDTAFLARVYSDTKEVLAEFKVVVPQLSNFHGPSLINATLVFQLSFSREIVLNSVRINNKTITDITRTQPNIDSFESLRKDLEHINSNFTTLEKNALRRSQIHNALEERLYKIASSCLNEGPLKALVSRFLSQLNDSTPTEAELLNMTQQLDELQK